jgi:hypothetical protein
MNKPGFSSSLLGALGLIVSLGCAQPSLAARLVDVSVVNRNTGERLTPYRHDGKLYIAGTPGDAYFIELKSRGQRVLTVLSVDGINVLTGQTAATLQSGYVIDGGQSYGISGWRKSMDDVAKFVFTALPNSYAARTGRPGNVGVIGVAVYREKAVPPPQAIVPYSLPVEPGRFESRPKTDSDSARDAIDGVARQAVPASAAKAEKDSASGEKSRANEASAAGALAQRRADQADSRSGASAEAESRAKKLGTGHGEREYSPTRHTEFERRSDTPDEIIAIHYDSRANLIARGIIPSPRLAEPTPFPAGAGFVPDPRG